MAIVVNDVVTVDELCTINSGPSRLNLALDNLQLVTSATETL